MSMDIRLGDKSDLFPTQLICLSLSWSDSQWGREGRGMKPVEKSWQTYYVSHMVHTWVSGRTYSKQNLYISAGIPVFIASFPNTPTPRLLENFPSSQFRYSEGYTNDFKSVLLVYTCKKTVMESLYPNQNATFLLSIHI